VKQAKTSQICFQIERRSVYKESWDEPMRLLCLMSLVSRRFVSENCIVMTTSARFTKKKEPIYKREIKIVFLTAGVYCIFHFWLPKYLIIIWKLGLFVCLFSSTLQYGG